MSCERRDGTTAVLKLSPDPDLGRVETSALLAWRSSGRVPRVLEFDRESGALLMEAIRPGTPLADVQAEARIGEIAGLVRDLHAAQDERDLKKFPPLVERVEFIFAFWGQRLQKPEVSSGVSRELFERSRVSARELATRPGRRALLHGDLHARNVLEGSRGLVAVDPRACVGDPAFDLVDWVLADGGDKGTLRRRARWLARAAGVDLTSLWRWCSCMAVLAVVNQLDSPGRRESTAPDAIRVFLDLATSEAGSDHLTKS